MVLNEHSFCTSSSFDETKKAFRQTNAFDTYALALKIAQQVTSFTGSISGGFSASGDFSAAAEDKVTVMGVGSALTVTLTYSDSTKSVISNIQAV